MRLIALVFAVALAIALFLAGVARGAWRLPVQGTVERGFAMRGSPYAAGQHRGVDLRASPGSVARAPCTGRVVVAGRVGTSGGVVTVLCGRWRASLLPLSTIFVRRGGSVSAGTSVGTVAPSADHAGLHLGVRRDGVRFGYVDPLRFLAPARPGGAPPLGPAPRASRARASPPPPRPLDAPPARPVAAPTTRPLTAPAARPLAAPADLAPWPAWVGLALALAGLGVRWRRRRAGGLRLGRAAARSAVQ